MGMRRTKLTRELKYTSLSTRISVLLGLIILVTMGAFSAVSLVKQEKDSIDSMSRSALLLSQTTEKILRFSMLKNRRSEISKAISDIVGEQGIVSVRILNHEGIIKFSSRRSEVDEHISRANQLCENCHGRDDGHTRRAVNGFYRYHFDRTNGLIYSSLPIYNSPSCYSGNCHMSAVQEASAGAYAPGSLTRTNAVHDSSQTILGFIEITVSAKRIIANLNKSRMQLIELIIIIAIIAAVIAYLSIRTLVGKPAKRLIEGTKRVAQGDFSRDIPPGKAELGALAESFNRMQRQLLTTQSQLIQSEKLASVGKLSDEIANEINNPLTGIIVHTESLIEQAPPGNAANEDLETILQEAMKIRESVRNILSLTGGEKPSFARVDIGRIIRHAVSVLEKFSSFRNIQIITGISKALPEIPADARMLEQVFLNLLLISSENMPSGGLLNISAVHNEKEGRIEIRFTDTGRPMPDSMLHALLDVSGEAAKENVERTGISLAVCRDIVTLHRGKVYAAPQGGVGTAITIELPV